MSNKKEKLFKLCQLYVDQRIDGARAAMASLQAAANEETKSSAGDKYETGRSMMQLEVEKISMQLSEANKLKQALSTLDYTGEHSIVQIGSVVYTSQGRFYIAISAGQLMLSDEVWFAISQGSPIGTKLMGLRAGQSFSFNQKVYEVERVG